MSPSGASHYVGVEEREEENSSSKGAAAAPSLANIREAALALEPLLSKSLAVEFATKDADLVLIAVPFFHARFADRRREPILNRAAFVRSVLSNPINAGFECVAGEWRPPPDYTAPSARPADRDRINAETFARRREYVARQEGLCEK